VAAISDQWRSGSRLYIAHLGVRLSAWRAAWRGGGVSGRFWKNLGDGMAALGAMHIDSTPLAACRLKWRRMLKPSSMRDVAPASRLRAAPHEWLISPPVAWRNMNICAGHNAAYARFLLHMPFCATSPRISLALSCRAAALRGSLAKRCVAHRWVHTLRTVRVRVLHSSCLRASLRRIAPLVSISSWRFRLNNGHHEHGQH